MHPRTQHPIKKPRRVNAAMRANAVTQSTLQVSRAESVLQINDDELLHLATDIACLRAARFRAVDVDEVRAEDVRDAQAEIAALIKRGTED